MISDDAIDLSGFTGWVPFARLPEVDVPRGPGVYVIARASDAAPTFLPISPAGHYKGRDPTEPVDALKMRWVAGTRIVYIGKANAGASGRRGLRKRLDEYRRYGAGSRTAAHTGGRRIWQLADHPALLVGWRETHDVEARPTERAMIAAFRAHYGLRPFANAAA